MLEELGDDGPPTDPLRNLLDDGYSIYTVSSDGTGLEVRTSAGLRTTVETVVAAAGGSAGDHLTEAWNAAYGRTPDPVKGYSEAIKAAEAALAPHISPTSTKQTLGTMIRDVAAKPDKWQLLGGTDLGVDTVLTTMRQLWNGQTSRHGGFTPTRHETAEEAQAAVM